MAPRRKTDAEKAFLKNRIHTTVVCKLSRICKIQQVRDEIQRTVIEMKQCQLEAYHLANTHVLRCLQEGLPLPSFDKTFFNRCCAGVMLEAEEEDKKQTLKAMASVLRPRKRRKTATVERSLEREAAESDDENLNDSRRKNKCQSKDEELLTTMRRFWSARAAQPAYKPPSLQYSAQHREELAQNLMVASGNMIALQFRRRLYQFIRFRFAPEGQLELSVEATRRLLQSCFRVREEVVPPAAPPATTEQTKPRTRKDRKKVTDPKPKVKKVWLEWDTTADPIELELRKWLGKVPWDWNIRKNLAHFVLKLHDMLTWMEGFVARHPKTKGTRLYSLLPYAKSFTTCYITMNGSTLYGICARIYKQTAWKLDSLPLAEQGGIATEEYFKKNRVHLLRQVFDVAQFETRLPGSTISKAEFSTLHHEAKKARASRYFADQVSTNGYGASVLLTRPKKADDYDLLPTTDDKARLDTRDPFEVARKRLPTEYFPDVMIGIDPGMRTLCTAVAIGRLPRQRVRRDWLKKRKKRKRKRLDRQFRRGQRITEITTREYRHMAKFNDFQAWHERLKKREPLYAALITGMPSFKTAILETYETNLVYFWKHLRFLVNFCAMNAFARWRFTRDRSKAKALDALAKRIVPKPSKQVCIAYGNWSRRDNIKGHASGPVKGFARVLQRRATVLPMDEFRTSKLCSCCYCPLDDALLFTKERVPDKDSKPMSEETLKRRAATKAKDEAETKKIKNPGLKGFKIVTKKTRNVLRCRNSACKSNFWNRDVNAARNMLELMKGYFLGLGRITEFVRGG